MSSDKGRGRRKKVAFVQSCRDQCVDCGTTDNLTLDHLDRSTKHPRLMRNRKCAWDRLTWEDLRKEVLKCEVVCRKCHDKRERLRDRLTLTGEQVMMPV